MERRDILKFLSLLLMDLTSKTQAAGPKKRVIVIGAGLAGLGAARVLHQQGHDVTVVEARDRIGGRIWTSNKWPDMHVDLGATWIHGVDGNPITALADKIGAKRLSTSYDSNIVYSTNGQELSSNEEAQLEKLREQVLKLIEKAQNKDPDVSIRQVVEALSRQSDSEQTQRFINFVLSGTLEQEYSGSAETLSVQWFDNDKNFEGGDELFVNGYRVITEYLAQGLDIKLGQVVQKIEWAQKPRVLTAKNTYTADQVLVTLPLGVLKANRVQFAPQLPAAKQQAIQKLGMGVLNKCYLRFTEAFWPEDVDWLEYIPAQHGEWTEWVSFMQAAKQPILLGFNAADRGREIEAWTDQKIVDSALQTLRTIFGKDIPKPLDYQITRWASDPFALGSYSFNAVGSSPKMRRDLAAPLGGKLFFSGEATDAYFSTAHGAYLSGVRAAQEILKG